MEMKRRSRSWSWALAVLAWAALVVGATAQGDELTLYVRRNFGYGGGSQIQGNFRFEVEGPADLVSVTYRVDEAVVATTTEPPFRIDFETDAYPHGWHNLTATGETADGRTLVSATRRFEFVSAEAGWQAAGQMGGTILLGVGAVIAILVVAQYWLVGRDRKAGRRGYGLLGGAICPKCGKPFGIHLWGLNALAGKFDRCDHCGKWSIVRRASPEALAAAEAADAPAATSSTPEVALERERRRVDDTRYSDDP